MNNKNIYLKAIYNNLESLIFLFFIIILQSLRFINIKQVEKFLPYYEQQSYNLFINRG